MANRELGVLPAGHYPAIIEACDRLIAGRYPRQFPTDMIQGGAGTSTNMNVNRVIANVALEIMGHAKRRVPRHQPNESSSIAHNPPTMRIQPHFAWR